MATWLLFLLHFEKKTNLAEVLLACWLNVSVGWMGRVWHKEEVIVVKSVRRVQGKKEDIVYILSLGLGPNWMHLYILLKMHEERQSKRKLWYKKYDWLAWYIVYLFAFKDISDFKLSIYYNVTFKYNDKFTTFLCWGRKVVISVKVSSSAFVSKCMCALYYYIFYIVWDVLTKYHYM